MTDYLDGIEAKLARADFHFEAVQREIDPIVKAEPELIRGEFDEQADRYLFRATRDSHSGVWLSPVIGDYVHNLRAALDYMAWALTTDEVRASKYASQIESPIFSDPDPYPYPEAAARKLRGVDGKAQTAIKCLQPFNGPDCRPNFSLAHPTDKPLWHLFELDNWDKHRTLNLTEHVGRSALVLPPELGIYTSPVRIAGFGGFKRGAVLARMQLRVSKPDVEMHLNTIYDVLFDRDGPESIGSKPVLQTLDDIRSETRNRVLPSLLRFQPRWA